MHWATNKQKDKKIVVLLRKMTFSGKKGTREDDRDKCVQSAHICLGNKIVKE